MGVLNKIEKMENRRRSIIQVALSSKKHVSALKYPRVIAGAKKGPLKPPPHFVVPVAL